VRERERASEREREREREEFVLDKDLRRSLKTTGSTTGRNVLAKAPEEHARHQPTQDGSGLWVL